MGYNIELEGQVAVVTGAAQGIGAAIAKKLTKAGAQVVINDVCTREQADTILSECEQVGKRPYYIRCNIADEESVHRMFDEISETFGRVDILVNNAGIVSDWEKSFAVNVKGTYFCCEAAKPYLEVSKGRIVILTSASIFNGGTGIPEYIGTKSGTYGLTMFFAKEYAHAGIRVNGVAPAVIMSKMLSRRFGSETAVQEHYKDIMPMGRIGYPDDIANVVLFLCCELSDYLCGEVLIADGGRMHVG